MNPADAIVLRDAAAVADPFRHTAALVELLRLRAGQLRDGRAGRPRPAKLQECQRATRSTAPQPA